jgi:hypothetical protein
MYFLHGPHIAPQRARIVIILVITAKSGPQNSAQRSRHALSITELLMPQFPERLVTRDDEQAEMDCPPLWCLNR